MAENMEAKAVTEKTETSEMKELQDAAKLFTELSGEMEAAGNQDMAQYYREKAKEFTADAEASSAPRLGAWAGYTASEWRDMATREFAKNGDSLDYKRYCENATKA